MFANDFWGNSGRGSNIHGESLFSHLGLWKERENPACGDTRKSRAFTKKDASKMEFLRALRGEMLFEFAVLSAVIRFPVHISPERFFHV